MPQNTRALTRAARDRAHRMGEKYTEARTAVIEIRELADENDWTVEEAEAFYDDPRNRSCATRAGGPGGWAAPSAYLAVAATTAAAPGGGTASTGTRTTTQTSTATRSASAARATSTAVSVSDLVPDPVAVLERGLAVFALPPGGRRPAPGWHGRCLADPQLVRRTWRAGDNIGVGCRASSLVGLDLDRDQGVDGIDAFAAACATAGADWPDTLTVRTPHGLHLYFRAPAGAVIGSSSGGLAGLGAGVDVRGPGRRRGGYLIGPGSVVEGVRYTVLRDAAIATLPRWLAGLLAGGGPAAPGAGGYAPSRLPVCARRSG